MLESRPVSTPAAAIEDQWLAGWDPTPGIVSVWAEPDGTATIWRRVDGALVRERARFRPWLVLDRLDDLTHLGADLGPELGRDGATARPTLIRRLRETSGGLMIALGLALVGQSGASDHRGQFALGDEVAVAENHGAFHGVFQFAHVAGPVVAQHAGQSLRRKSAYALAVAAGKALQKMGG